jgi:hemerythrin-like domain-containing protein
LIRISAWTVEWPILYASVKRPFSATAKEHSVTSLLDRLRADHRNFALLVRAVEAALKRFNAGEAPDYELLLAAVEYLHDYADRQHHPTEDIVFRRLARCAPDAAEGCGDLLADHQRLEALTERFLATLREVLADGTVARDSLDREAFAFLDAQRKHMRAEDARFFAAAERALAPRDWEELALEARGRADPLFGPRAEARFAALRRAIDDLAQESGAQKTGA